MERIPNGRYTKEFREEAVKMATEGGLQVLEISKRLSLPKSTLEHWISLSRKVISEGLAKVNVPPRRLKANWQK
jgi:transposase-like protein